MNKNKKRIAAFTGVVGMLLALSCHMFHMPIQAKETSISLIQNPVYTDCGRKVEALHTKNVKTNESEQSQVSTNASDESTEAFCRLDASAIQGKKNTEEQKSCKQKQQTVMAGSVSKESQKTEKQSSSEQKSEDSTTKDTVQPVSKNTEKTGTLLIPEQWNIEITDQLHEETAAQEGQETASLDEKTAQTKEQTGDEQQTEASQEVKEQTAKKKEQEKKKLEQKKKRALQRRKKAAAKKKKQKRAKACQTMSGSTTDRQILERIVEAEAGGENQKGKILVANVILNRVQNKEFPDTIKGVVFAHKGSRYQFSPIADGRYYKVRVSNDTKKAVKQALQGVDGSRGALYFMERSAADASNVTWFDTALTRLFRYGCHEFYK